MSNSIRRIIDAVTAAYDSESEALEEIYLDDKVARDVAIFIGGLSTLEWRNRIELTEDDQ